MLSAGLLLLLATLFLGGRLIFALLLLLATLFLGGRLTFDFLLSLATLFFWGNLVALLVVILFTLTRRGLYMPARSRPRGGRKELGVKEKTTFAATGQLWPLSTTV